MAEKNGQQEEVSLTIPGVGAISGRGPAFKLFLITFDLAISVLPNPGTPIINA